MRDDDATNGSARTETRAPSARRARVAGIAVAIAIVIALIAVLVVRRRPAPESRPEKPSAARDAERAAKLRACGLPQGATFHEPESISGECQRAVLRTLASPETAAFPGMFDEDGALASPLGCETTYRSWVESRDERGLEVRRAYVCTYDPRTGTARIEE
jgi:hypothetical protein